MLIGSPTFVLLTVNSGEVWLVNAQVAIVPVASLAQETFPVVHTAEVPVWAKRMPNCGLTPEQPGTYVHALLALGP